MYLFKNGNCYRTEQKLAQHSYPALHNLFIVFNQLNLNIPDKCKLFDSMVGSVLNFAAEVWVNHNGKILNQYIVSLLEKYCVLRNQQILKVYTEKLEYTLCI